MFKFKFKFKPKWIKTVAGLNFNLLNFNLIYRCCVQSYIVHDKHFYHVNSWGEGMSHVCLSRQQGHTHDLSQLFLENQDKSLYITLNRNLMRNTWGATHPSERPRKSQCYTMQTLDHAITLDQFTGRKRDDINFIFIDNWSHVKDYEMAYRCLDHLKSKFNIQFVFTVG